MIRNKDYWQMSLYVALGGGAKSEMGGASRQGCMGESFWRALSAPKLTLANFHTINFVNLHYQ